MLPQGIGRPVHVPQGVGDLAHLVEASVGAFAPAVLAGLKAFLSAPDAQGLVGLEEATTREFLRMASHVVAGIVGCLHRDRRWVEGCVDRAREQSAVPLRHHGKRTTPVRFLGGLRLLLDVSYLSEDRSGRPGPRRGRGRRGPAGGGLYPTLRALGIRDQSTPALSSEVAKQATRTASFEEARQALAERGVAMDEKSVWGLTLQVGEEALRQRDARIEAARAGIVLSQEFAGKRIVLSADGGRLRLREGGQRGRRGKKRRRRFRTPWREPKLVVAYVIDARGRRDAEHPVLYDGTMEDADRAFEILVAELRLRGATDAKEIVVTADGAPWIWDRTDDLARALGIDPSRIVKVADFYHAVEHLTAVAELCAGWTDEKRVKWVRRMRRHLKAGRVDTVIDAIAALRRGRNAGRIGTEQRYFETRRERMRYDEFRRRGVPMGSGAVESAIRRVVNLRMKGASIFWRGPNAERMLHLRCYLKAGRWDELMQRVHAAGASCAISRRHRGAA